MQMVDGQPASFFLSTKLFFQPTAAMTHLVHLVKEVRVEHRNFVNEQNLGRIQMFTCSLVHDDQHALRQIKRRRRRSGEASEQPCPRFASATHSQLHSNLTHLCLHEPNSGVVPFFDHAKQLAYGLLAEAHAAEAARWMRETRISLRTAVVTTG